MDATNPRRPKALLLDDDPVVLRLLGTALEARGFDVRAASDGEVGLALLLDELLDLDVVVADEDLPARDAGSLLHLLRGAGGEHDLGVVVLAGSSADAHQRFLALGADAVVDRADGPSVAAEAVAGVAARRAACASGWLDSARPAFRGAVNAARSVLAWSRDLLPAAG